MSRKCSSDCKNLNVILVNHEESFLSISESLLGLFGQNCQNFDIFIINLHSNNEDMHNLNEYLTIYPEIFVKRIKILNLLGPTEFMELTRLLDIQGECFNISNCRSIYLPTWKQNFCLKGDVEKVNISLFGHRFQIIDSIFSLPEFNGELLVSTIYNIDASNLIFKGVKNLNFIIWKDLDFVEMINLLRSNDLGLNIIGEFDIIFYFKLNSDYIRVRDDSTLLNFFNQTYAYLNQVEINRNFLEFYKVSKKLFDHSESNNKLITDMTDELESLKGSKLFKLLVKIRIIKSKLFGRVK